MGYDVYMYIGWFRILFAEGDKLLSILTYPCNNPWNLFVRKLSIDYGLQIQSTLGRFQGIV